MSQGSEKNVTNLTKVCPRLLYLKYLNTCPLSSISSCHTAYVLIIAAKKRQDNRKMKQEKVIVKIDKQKLK